MTQFPQMVYRARGTERRLVYDEGQLAQARAEGYRSLQEDLADVTPDVTPETQAAPVRRGRGRPPKVH